NRLDATIGFASLAPETVAKVVDKFVMQLEAQLADRQVSIELSDAARDWLAKRGFDPLNGARPLARVIQEHIKKPLAEELLCGTRERGGVAGGDVRAAQLPSASQRGGPPPADESAVKLRALVE